MSQVVSI